LKSILALVSLFPLRVITEEDGEKIKAKTKVRAYGIKPFIPVT
jgi:hypothetical protein